MEYSIREKLSREDIAIRYERMMRACFGNNYDQSKPANLKKLLKFFIKKQYIEFNHDQDLGRLPNNKKIYGSFSVNPIRIDIDKSLPAWSSKFCFSLAHEIGHFVLHRKLIGVGRRINREKLPADTAEIMKYREMAGASDLERVEWQANEFALCLIMPPQHLIKNIKSIQQDLGILRNLGFVYLDHQPHNQIDFGMTLSLLGKTYSAPCFLIRRRLRFLNILIDVRRQKTTRNIADLNNSSIQNLYQTLNPPTQPPRLE